MLTTLRKFGLEFYDLKTMIWNMNVFLRVMTLNIDPRNEKRIPIICYILTVSLLMSYFYVYLFSMAWFVFWRCYETGDMLAALIIVSLGISSAIGTVKLVFMILQQNDVMRIVSECLKMDSSVIPQSRFSNNMLRTLRTVKKRAIAFWLVIIGNGIIYVLIPVITPGRHLMEDQFVFYGLEPMFETPNYQIAYVLSFCGVVVTCYPPANIQAFIIIISGYIEAQMLALTEEMEHLYQDAEDNYRDTPGNHFRETAEDFGKNKCINEYINERLKAITKTHARNIMLMKEVERVYSGAIVFEFVLLGGGLISELLGGLENTYIEVPYALMQVGMDCFTGQRIMDACAKFEAAVYSCKWERFNKSNMKIVQIMLQNSQKTMKLSAGGVTILNFQCFMTIIRSTYSAYTTLRSTMHK